jgi:hypothetical protein
VYGENGLFGIIRWVWPLLPNAFHPGGCDDEACCCRRFYASILAIQQDDVKD